MDGFATVVSTSEARLAGAAGDVGFDCDPVTNLEVADR